MFYKQYGDTKQQVSAIGFGAMRFDEEDVKAARYDKCAEVLLYAHEKGINYFDTAPFYCDDKSEEITGMALDQLKRDSFYVSSKMNLWTIGNEATRDAFRKRLEQTLTRLKVDYLDFYYLWCMLDVESYYKQGDLLYRFFEEAKSEGLIRNIVFSSHMPGNELEQVVGDEKFKGVLVGYNALNYHFRIKGIEAAHQNGMGVVVMNPLGGGLIPQNPEVFKYLTEGTDLNVAQAALRFVASHKEVTVTLAGCTTKAHVDDAVKAVEGLKEQSARQITAAYEEKGMKLNTLCTGCGYCKKCPLDIDIPKFMDGYNHKILGENMIDRVNYHWGLSTDQAKKCIGCNKCEKLCTQHLPIVARLKEIANS